MNEWALVGFGYGEDGIVPEGYRSLTRFEAPAVTMVGAVEALELVLEGAGATGPERDAVDRRVVREVRTGTGAIIDSPWDAGGYPALAGGNPPADADGDGMPDDWERDNGLDPEDASDGNGDRDGDGYTNVEEFLHTLG